MADWRQGMLTIGSTPDPGALHLTQGVVRVVVVVGGRGGRRPNAFRANPQGGFLKGPFLKGATPFTQS